MKFNERIVLRQHRSQLVDQMNVDSVSVYLYAKSILTSQEFELTTTKSPSAAKSLFLLETLEAKESFTWSDFMEAFTVAKQTYLKSKLEATLNEMPIILACNITSDLATVSSIATTCEQLHKKLPHFL